MADREPTQTASPVWQRGEEHNTERLVMSRAFDDVVQQTEAYMNKLDLILCAVVNQSGVYSQYLLEDNDFRRLLVSFGNRLTINDAIDRLVIYINENY